MTDLLTIQNVTPVGILIVACWYLIKRNAAAWHSLTEQGRVERQNLLDQYKEIREENKVERREWLAALAENTNQLKNVADKLQAIPTMQKDLDELKCKVDLFSMKR